MNEKKDPPPYHLNAPGPFYVNDGECIACGVPEHFAPDLMTNEHKDGRYHCYFKKQPSNPAELEQAIQAVSVSCCAAVTYSGDDPVIIKRLAEIEELVQLYGKS